MNITDQYSLVTVWKNNYFGIDEKCAISNDGYVGNKTGNVYSFDLHYHSEQYLAIVKDVSLSNETGMYHLDSNWNKDNEINNYTEKLKWKGRELIVEKAHFYGEHQIYRSVFPIHEYWEDSELKIINKIQ